MKRNKTAHLQKLQWAKKTENILTPQMQMQADQPDGKENKIEMNDISSYIKQYIYLKQNKIEYQFGNEKTWFNFEKCIQVN